MNASFVRIGAIVKADFLVRFRRTSTLVMFLLLCVAAYLWIPAPSTGRSLLQISKQRALYNSAALSAATASLCTLLLSLLGFYMVSNSLRRDIQARTGFIIASTNVRNSEYIFGKFLGNAVFLTAVVAGFMLSSMGMQLVRGEAPLQPLVFLKHYALMVPPMIVFVSVVALIFESIRFLSGKFGDVAYFFLWMFLVAGVALVADNPKTGFSWVSCFDTTGFAYMLGQFKEVAHTNSVSIGSSPYDKSMPPYIFPGFALHLRDVLPRLASILYPLLVLPLALLFFHRFDPVRIKASAQKLQRGFVMRVNQWLKPLVRPLGKLNTPGKASFLRSLFSDAILSFQMYPVALLLVLGFWVASAVNPVSAIRSGVLPWTFPAMAMVMADLSTREQVSGSRALVFSTPHLKPLFVWWKFGSALLVALSFVAVAAAKLVFVDPDSALSLMIGAMFVAAIATALGIMTSNPKTFLAVFLLFWYVAMSGGKESPSLDFAGWFGSATATVRLTYAGLSFLMLAAAEAVYRLELRRRY